MIIDQNLILSGSANANGAWTGQSIAASAGTIVSTNVIDKAPLAGNQVADWGAGEDIDVSISVLTAITSGGAATVQFQLVEADDAAISSNVQVVSESAAYAYTELTTGKQVVLGYPRSTPRTAKRYLAVRYVIGTAATTGGTVIAALVNDVQDPAGRTFASGFSVA